MKASLVLALCIIGLLPSCSREEQQPRGVFSSEFDCGFDHGDDRPCADDAPSAPAADRPKAGGANAR